MKNQFIAHVSLLVRDYDEALDFYVGLLGFELLEDRRLDSDKRWVLVSPKGAGACSLLLARASTEEQLLYIGNQAGGRVFLFLYTDDFWRDYSDLREKGVQFIRLPETFEYGTVAVFEDLYGNKWDLLEPSIAENNPA
ncbi:MAG: VOC family protein [Bacteroidetes bacterium]|nr:VOC family protein [Bacteroidota bacterium]